MAENTILYLIIGIVISFAFSFLTKYSSKKVAKNPSGRYNLKMNKLYGIVGVVSLILGFFCSVYLPLIENSSEVIIGIVLFLLIFWGLGIPSLMCYRNHSLSFDNKSIQVSNIYGKKKEIQWSDICTIKFNLFSGFLDLKTNKESIRVHQHLVGITHFADYIEKYTKWTCKELKLPIRK